ncbi:hypothetical protein JX265_001030 [Neoarthrinium moseri]|uniref:Ankyrin n=1 Tax=Neoarthrinium moseri TaxID=1658444 RepID=A0A9P9WX14_9PEZI|nr:hypothetical protein JX265_001030 [Neoarthrinium moseri]
MDPLTIATSVVALASLAAKVGHLIGELRENYTSLPGRLHALGNEVEDLRVVLHRVASLSNDRERLKLDTDEESNIPDLIRRGEEKLLTLEEILGALVVTASKKRELLFRSLQWRREQSRIASIQDDIKRVKSNFNILLGVSNSRDMMQIRLELDRLSMNQSPPQYNDGFIVEKALMSMLNGHHETMSGLFSQQYSRVDDRLSRVEGLLESQTSRMKTSQISQFGSLYNPLPPPARMRPARPMSPGAKQRHLDSSSVRLRLRQHVAACRAGCPCACHVTQRAASPTFMNKLLGQLFIGYTGFPFLGRNCDSRMCERSQGSSMSVEYWFPASFCFSQILRLQLAYGTDLGPSLQLSTLRQVSDSAECVTFALNGNIDGLKNLFTQGFASPRDWALYGQQYETCKFLMSAGADPTYRPIATSDDCPSDKVCDIILRGNLPSEVLDILQVIAEGSDFIERQRFARIHKLVLRLCAGSLEEELQTNAEGVDFADAGGRTALQWAAARGDDRAVITLLSFGADPNNMDNKLNTPLTLAANQNHTVCVRLLLEAGALPDPQLPRGGRFGTPLNCAARNARDPVLMKTLLDFDAKIEASGVDGVTPLLHVARGNSATHAMLLLEYGANINATSKSGQTPLTAAIQFNNHAVLKLLLGRWFEYNECPRLKGPNLLDIVARFADIETIMILTGTEHLRTRTDESYIMNHYTHILEARLDASDALVESFEDLLSVLKATSHNSLDSKLESGLLEQFESLPNSDDDTDTDLFTDALEYISNRDEARTSTSCPYDLQKRPTI